VKAKGKPVESDELSSDAWPKLSSEQQATAIAELKSFADDSTNKIGRPLHLMETQYFLFYTDLPAREGTHWASLLDRMYARLSELFAVKAGVNIWRGKALILVFSKADDYHHYEQTVEHAESKGTAGMCHQLSDGTVRIAFYRQANELDFAHILVHESVHGFIHRYRSPVHIVSWINEGLAETIASELVPQRGRANATTARARASIKEHHGDIGDMFTQDHISDWQYPVAETLCTFMILESKRNYVAFINGIKDGDPWEESLANNYKAPLDRLVPAYGSRLGVRGLRTPAAER
jgi:hypothetical protein